MTLDQHNEQAAKAAEQTVKLTPMDIVVQPAIHVTCRGLVAILSSQGAPFGEILTSIAKMAGMTLASSIGGDNLGAILKLRNDLVRAFEDGIKQVPSVKSVAPGQFNGGERG